MLNALRPQMILLACMQALMLINNVTLVAVSGLAGMSLTENKAMATLAVTGYVVGGAVWAMPAAAFMNRYGRRAGYTLGSIVAMFGAVLGWYAMGQKSLLLLCLATFVVGLYSAFGASLRFAAADVADEYKPSFKARAISLVLAGGIVGGVVGPEVAKWSRTWLPSQFSGTYLTLAGFALLSLLLAQLLRLPTRPVSMAEGPARPLAEILRQPACWVAITNPAGDTVFDIAAQLCVDRVALEAAVNDPVIKEQLKDEVDHAIQIGVFGAPYVLIDGQPFFGADRLPQIEKWLETGGF